MTVDFPHGGDLLRLAEKAGRPPEEILDFSASINPLGPPESLRRVISRHVEMLRHYPDPGGSPLAAALAADLNVEKERIILGNGSTEILYAIPRARGKKRAVIPIPSYHDYGAAAKLAGLETVAFPLGEADGFLLDCMELASRLRGDEIVFIGQPNNPTGRSVETEKLTDLARSFPDTVFVVDESFAGFIPGYRSLARQDVPNVITVRSLTKFFALPGLRLGFACATVETAARLRPFILPWSVNTLAQAAGLAALLDREYADRTREAVSLLRRELASMLRDIVGLAVFPSEANFLLVKLTDRSITAARLADHLLREGIAIRVCNTFAGFPDSGASFFRVAVRTAEENTLLADALRRALHGGSAKKPARKHFSIMFQGTSSNAGKSVLTAALCRILLQDGFRVAPFKAQNMSLNSFVTREGLEMGRAQVVQAQACRLDPDARMNPVLLKPASDVGSQVIVMGRPVRNMSVDEYIAYKPEAWKAVTSAYDELAAEFDGIILEGAGSPGEVNLKRHDIVNMRMARHAGAPVLLVGDIDRGGVFASFVGTMEVLAEWERNLVAGFVVNRFRGRQSLLGDAFRYTEEHTGRPVFGVIPFLPRLGLPEEDSVGFKGGLYDRPAPSGEHVEIGLLDLPHISNFTDFEPFLGEPDVHLRIIRKAGELAAAGDRLAALLLPGSKNVIADMAYLAQSGLTDLVRRLAGTGRVEIVGICGGFQMLGGRIDDPHGLESDGGGAVGLSLLDIETTLEKDKTLTRRTLRHEPSGVEAHGYEIHHGRSVSRHKAVFTDEEGERICASSDDGMIWGSYLHGMFDADPFRRWFIDRLRARRGLAPIGRVVAAYDLEAAFDRLADTVREGLNMERIYRLLRV